MQENPIFKEIDVARALKDEAYRAGLDLEARQAIEALVGKSELSEQTLEEVSGGFIMRDTIIIKTGIIGKPVTQPDSLQ